MAIRIPCIQVNGKISQLPAGDKFANSVVDSFVHVQTISSSVWTIVHNLDKYPSVSVLLSDSREVQGNNTYPDKNTVIITFSKPLAGKAILN